MNISSFTIAMVRSSSLYFQHEYLEAETSQKVQLDQYCLTS